MKPIETIYKGYRFRSRLEARWAVFFDALGVRYEYEKEGFDLGKDGLYLPDFWLPDIPTHSIHDTGLWVEIKPPETSKDADDKMTALVRQTGCAGIILYGEPMRGYVSASDHGDYWNDWAMQWVTSDNNTAWDCPYIFCFCPWCGKIGVEFDGRGARVCGYRAHYDTEEAALDAIRHLGHHRADDKCYTGTDKRILDACVAARSARFEHGEHGAYL